MMGAWFSVGKMMLRPAISSLNAKMLARKCLREKLPNFNGKVCAIKKDRENGGGLWYGFSALFNPRLTLFSMQKWSRENACAIISSTTYIYVH